jgi:hypothetical protein
VGMGDVEVCLISFLGPFSTPLSLPSFQNRTLLSPPTIPRTLERPVLRITAGLEWGAQEEGNSSQWLHFLEEEEGGHGRVHKAPLPPAGPSGTSTPW